tara:strand:- start:1465 stop:1992 length:528 start_codon:yes stop_codon:yes gene_type:complete
MLRSLSQLRPNKSTIGTTYNNFVNVTKTVSKKVAADCSGEGIFYTLYNVAKQSASATTSGCSKEFVVGALGASGGILKILSNHIESKESKESGKHQQLKENVSTTADLLSVAAATPGGPASIATRIVTIYLTNHFKQETGSIDEVKQFQSFTNEQKNQIINFLNDYFKNHPEGHP